MFRTLSLQAIKFGFAWKLSMAIGNWSNVLFLFFPMRFTTSYGSFIPKDLYEFDHDLTSWRHWNGGLFQGNHPYNWPQVSTIFRWVKYYSSVRLYTYITVHINIIYPDWGMVIYPILWYDKGSSFPVVQLPGLALLTLAAFALRKGIFSWCSEHASQFCDPCSWKVTSPRINHTSATPESTCLYTHNVS